MDKRGSLLRNSGAILLSGFLFFGQYFDSTLADLEGRGVKCKGKDGTEGVNIEITGVVPVDFSHDTYKVNKAGKLIKK